jgi:hypothetical protein
VESGTSSTPYADRVCVVLCRNVLYSVLVSTPYYYYYDYCVYGYYQHYYSVLLLHWQRTLTAKRESLI